MGEIPVMGMEVPFFNNDSLKWVEASIPSAVGVSGNVETEMAVVAPVTQDYASYTVIGKPPTYLIWRICKRLSKAIEILEISPGKGIPRIGLRVVFPEALSPFAYICKNERSSASGCAYLLYALSISGIAYLVRLKNISAYSSSFVFSSNEYLHFDTKVTPDCSPITASAATNGCILVGRDDGSVSCFRLGELDENALDFMFELKDEAALGRLWGLMSRTRSVGSVKELVMSEIQGRQVVFVLHSDGSLRVWDLFRRSKLLNQSLSSPGISISRLWVGPVDDDAHAVRFVILCTKVGEVNMQEINIFSLNFASGERYSLSHDSYMQTSSLSERKLVDVKLSSDKVWILTDEGLLEQKLPSVNAAMEDGKCYTLQEGFIAEHLFQSSEQSLDDLYQNSCSIFTSSKVQVIGFISSIFLRRLLHPGVHDNSIIRLTLEDYGQHWTDLEFQALSVNKLRTEILMLVEREAFGGSAYMAFKCCKEFCSRYFGHWCKTNVPFGLFIDSLSGAVGLIRQNGVSLFRSLEDIELLASGTSCELEDFSKFGFDASSDGLKRGVLFEVLHCTRRLNQQLGAAISPIFYESVAGAPSTSPEDVVTHFLKTLECGNNTSVAVLHVAELGADVVQRKELADHKKLRKFSIDMLISLHALCKKTSGWHGVLTVVESYLNFLVPRKLTGNMNLGVVFSANIPIIVQATSQVAGVMFESALHMLLFLSYLLDISGQVYMLPDDMSKIQLELIPMIHEIITEWLIIHFIGTTPSESFIAEDFSSQLSTLRIDSNSEKIAWTQKLGSVGFTLAFIPLWDAYDSSKGWSSLSLSSLPNPGRYIDLVRHFSSWIIWGSSGENPLSIFGHLSELVVILLKHGQFTTAENLLMIMEAHLSNEKSSGSMQSADSEWCVRYHLLGCCLLAQAKSVPQGPSKEKKVNEAMRCFFRASSGEQAAHALQKLPYEARLPQLTQCASNAAWKLHYYQWVMQKFEQYNISDAAVQFSLAALEQVDEAARHNGDSPGAVLTDESTTSIKGRLWANVFKFSLDLDEYYDAYCAIVSNPDEENKIICLRRFIIVLYERGATKILCDGHLPFIGLNDKVEQELSWKATRSDVSTRPNPYKLLYAFQMQQQNWRKAATYIFLYSVQLKNEMSQGNYQNTSLALQERLNAISAAINCLNLVHPMYAWIDLEMCGNHLRNTNHPSKKPRKTEEQVAGRVGFLAERSECYVGIEKLEDEFVVTSSEHLLSQANVRWTRSENEKLPSGLVDLLVESNMYDMAFTVVLRFWKDSGLKREIERVFSNMAMKCCPSKGSSSVFGSPGLLLTSSKDEAMIEGSFDADPQLKQHKSGQWELLEQYLEKYKRYHGRLPVVVAETLLCSDPQIELPLWLVNMFKGAGRTILGMAGQESDPAALFRLYVDYGRYPDATELLVGYIEKYASVKPAGIIHRKRPFAAWFPYTTIERLWCHLEESIRKGHMTEQCEKLKVLLHGALRSHLILLKGDSEDAISSAV